MYQPHLKPMPRLCALLLLLLLTACGTLTSTTPQPLPPTQAATSTEDSSAQPTAPVADEPTVAPTEAATTAPTEVAPAATESASAATAVPDANPTQVASDAEGYLDDRSNPTSLMQSFANALNLKQYVRAYSYWKPDAQQLLPFTQFEEGYAETEAVKLNVGEIHGDAGAGNFYYTVPVAMETRTTADENEYFVGCYLLHISNPGVQGTPPFQPLALESAYVQEVESSAAISERMPTICEEGGYTVGTPIAPIPTPAADDISAQVYIDDRSNPVAVLRSLFNAVNSGQFIRAYSYWQPDSPDLLPPDEFEAGYADTASVELVTGEITTGAGAGQRFYAVPVTLTAENRDGSTETFVGCYVLHQTVPQISAVPFYQPLGIRSATVEAVPADADTAALMATVCQE